MRLGGFIITYNRSKILLDTIRQLFDQTHPPELLWIIDNSDNLETDHAIATLLDSRIRYFRMGYNAGPAGAAVKGLELCGKEGLDWIYWGDDNDPPFRNDCFERLLAISEQNPFTGVLGTVGQFFDRKKGVIKRVQSRLLEKKDILEVDYVAGGMCMLVSGKVARGGIAPDPKLFFGFEELDFCLKVARKGFTIVVDCKLFLEARKKYERLDFERARYKKKESLVREYYSLRNLLLISDSLTLNSMKRQLVKKWSFKLFYGFRYGFKYGISNFKFISTAFYHYHIGKFGMTLPLMTND
ncbi:glycosyltransferase family 2 protein [Algoriphagus winogradskyi]|uniref:Glycosyltransferase, GT2 family n=1 Tax=Algoriphagus winogradskyi TaxID=237017 RepID=A0ABY1NVU0_9BACT|nr:glycosyltransferase [Algoriphagus winogradskyi]SMP19774.1 Glycosyltransferase, GT2 family [Algoriphagus winogradskyi]